MPTCVCFKKRRRGREGGRCSRNGRCLQGFPEEGDVSGFRTHRGTRGLQAVQCTPTVLMVWPSLNLHVMNRNASIEDTLKHHLSCSSGHFHLLPPPLLFSAILAISSTTFADVNSISACVCIFIYIQTHTNYDEEIKMNKLGLMLPVDTSKT